MKHPLYEMLGLEHKASRGKVLIKQKVERSEPTKDHLGYYYEVYFLDHPVFAGEVGHTSMVVKEVDGGFETLNSRYEYA